MLRLVLTLATGLAILQDAVCAADGRQELGFGSVDPLALLRAVRDHEGLACGRVVTLQTMRQLRLLLLALQLRQWAGLLRLVEVGRRRILMVLVFRKY